MTELDTQAIHYSFPYPTCARPTDPEQVYTPRRVATCECGEQDRLEARAMASGLDWEVVLVERVGGGRRELAVPTAGEKTAAAHMHPHRTLGAIPAGQETAVLRRHGFTQLKSSFAA